MGAVSVITQVNDKSNNTLVTIASARPNCLAFLCWLPGSFDAMMDIKIILSIPSTISSAVSVINDIQTSGFNNHSINYQFKQIKF
jgi:hypothetical protein